MKKTSLFSVGITNDTTQNILEYILSTTSEKYYVVTPNPEILVYATRHAGFQKVLNNARLALADGVGLLWGANLMGKPLAQRTTGVDLMEMLCQRASKKPITIGFLGGKGNIAKRTAECLKQRYPGLTVILAESGNPDEETVTMIQNRMGQKGQNGQKGHEVMQIDILFVAFGFPKQEEWIARYLDRLPVHVAMTVGGAFDYISGEVARAPGFLRAIGLEWLFRLIRQPWRIKRQLALIEFVWLILRARLFPWSF